MEKVTYIVPVHEFTDESKKMYESAFGSLAQLKGAEDFEVFVVGPKDVLKKCKDVYKEVTCTQELTLIETEETDLFAKINEAVMKCTTPYFSILEFDDAYYQYWNVVAQRYIESERYSVIFPIAEMFTTEGKIIGLANELAWDAAFVGEENLGFIQLSDLLTFRDFQLTGSYIKTEDFISLGKFKPELKVFAYYEYLLRAANAEKKLFVAPRCGYKHVVMREGSYLDKITKELPREEGIALLETVIAPYKKEEPQTTGETKE